MKPHPLRRIPELVLLSILLVLHASAQTLSLQGTVVDRSNKKPLQDAHVILMQVTDTAKLGAVTSATGGFKFSRLSRGNYVLKITHVGYAPYQASVVLTGEEVNLGNIELVEISIPLGEVEVQGKLPLAVVKGDTTEFFADAFKTTPDANAEDLVAKIPGVTVEEGRVQAQGETVRQVLVDGRPFFGEDPNAALRNLPAEIVERVQVFDRQSEQAEFTGFSDGNEYRVLNLITRMGMRNAQFGRFGAGYGPDNHYKVGGIYNRFEGFERITLLLNSNNVNEQNFSLEDLVGAINAPRAGMARQFLGRGGGGGGRGGLMGMQGRLGGLMGAIGDVGSRLGGLLGGAMMGDFLVAPRGGISTTHAAGINYSNKWGSNLDLSGSYFFNLSDADERSDLFRTYIVSSDAGRTYDEAEKTSSRNINHRFNMRLEWHIDSSHSILVRPRLSVQQNDGNTGLLAASRLGSASLQQAGSDVSSELSGLNASNEFLYRYRFATRGRTFSLSMNTNYRKNSGESELESVSMFFVPRVSIDSIAQISDLNKNGSTVGLNAVYTEPLAANQLLQLTYATAFTFDDSEKRTFNQSPITSQFDRLDTSLTNTYSNRYRTHAWGAGYRFQGEEMQLMIGASFQQATLSGDQKFPASVQLSRTFQNILPQATLRWRFSSNRNLQLLYQARTSPPSIDQLQNVIDNSNPIQLSVGNPALREQYQHILTTRYSLANPASAEYFFVMMGGMYSTNFIGNSTILAIRDTTLPGNLFIPSGSQVRRPENLSPAFSLRSLATYGFWWEPIESNINLNVTLGVTKTPSLINGKSNDATTPTIGGGVVVSSNISDKVDFTISSQTSYSTVQNTLQPDLDTDYLNQRTRFRLEWIFAEGFVVSSNIFHRYTSNLSTNYKENSLIWYLGVGKKFLENNAAEIRLSVFDLLNQNTNIQRNVTDTYIEDTRTNLLRRYILLTFSYNLRNIAFQPPRFF
ncbi:MAG: hypothetical protein FJ215_10455 [Ignavibacteria bacterium]|nr:hypothetical protein [Ignavibacteria bacterium]